MLPTCRTVHLLKWTVVVVAQGQGVLGGRQKGVVDRNMAGVVHACGHDQCQLLRRTQRGRQASLALVQERKHRLRDVSSVGHVVVGLVQIRVCHAPDLCEVKR